MFKRVLVPVDLSGKSPAAVDVASRVTSAGGELILLHVIETIEHLDFNELRSFYTKLEKNATTELRRLADRVPQGISVKTETVYGKRARSIIDIASQQGADLIVLNSHRVQPGAGFPSISYEVAVLAVCPVLLLK